VTGLTGFLTIESGTGTQMKARNTFIAVTLFWGFVAQGAVLPQSEKLKWYQDRFTYFYHNPQPERLVGFVERWQSDAGGRWDAYPPLVVFLAVIFKNHPEWIERLVPSNLTPASSTAVVGALRLAGDAVVPADISSRIAQAGTDPILKQQLTGLPTQLSDVRISLPTHLDILWGAAVASGDDRYVFKIIDFYAQIADQSKQVGLDIAEITSKYPNTPKEILTALRKKYGDREFYRVVFASTALWGMSSNARQHTFIRRALVVYTGDHMGTPAANAIIMVYPQMLYFLGERRADLLRSR
jgi:hypothetical protein